MSKGTMDYTGELTILSCWCGIVHAVPTDLRHYQERRFNKGEEFPIYCPLGHTHIPAGKSQAAIERERADQLARELANRNDDLRIERLNHAATKGQLTKARKRADRGVCQHCKRSFVDVQRHVATKHPEMLDASQ
jgi:hypothetical protein